MERETGLEPATFCLGSPEKPAIQSQKAHSAGWLETFIASRKGERGLTTSGEAWIRNTLGKFLFSHPNALAVTRPDIERFLAQFPTPFNRHSYFRAIRAFYNWLEAQEIVALSPCHRMKSPKLPTVVLSHPSSEQVTALIGAASCARDKAIVSLFADTGLRLSELAQITTERVDWERQTIRVFGKGRKERTVKFGTRTGELMREISTDSAIGGSIWGMNANGILSALDRLERRTGIKANPHSFRRYFAIELRRRGVDSLTIQYLGGWESLEMVERYSRAAKQELALAEYQPLTDSLRAGT